MQLNRFVGIADAADASNQVHNDIDYIEKYLPNLWTALLTANSDDARLLTVARLQEPSKNLTEVLKECIIEYLMAIKPVAMVKLNAVPGESCSVRLVKEHVDILRRTSNSGFRCLRSYKIGMSNVYVESPQVKIDEFGL